MGRQFPVAGGSSSHSRVRSREVGAVQAQGGLHGNLEAGGLADGLGTGDITRFFPRIDRIFFGKHLIHFFVLKMNDFWNFVLDNCILDFDAEQYPKP